jgi:hypothetical protein
MHHEASVNGRFQEIEDVDERIVEVADDRAVLHMPYGGREPSPGPGNTT